MNPNKYLSRSCVTLCLLMSAQAVLALPSDQDQPIHIEADKQSISLKEDVVVYTGDVKLTQGTLQITADKLTIRRDKGQKAESALAEGSPARYQQQSEADKPLIHAEASSINYQIKNEMLVLDKNVSIEQNGSYTKGGHVDYDIKNQMVKATKGDNGSSGRVETVIQPKTDK